MFLNRQFGEVNVAGAAKDHRHVTYDWGERRIAREHSCMGIRAGSSLGDLRERGGSGLRGVNGPSDGSGDGGSDGSSDGGDNLLLRLLALLRDGD